MDNRFYPGVECDPPRLVAELQQLFEKETYEVQTMQVSRTSVVQARKSGTLRDIAGLSSALTVKITPERGGTRVEIGMQKWFDKAAVAAVAIILQPWLLALPVLGAYWQHRATENAWNIVEAHIAAQAGGYVPPMPGRCGTCGASVNADATFCAACGSNLRLSGCPSCGAPQRDSTARFCYSCGKAM